MAPSRNGTLALPLAALGWLAWTIRRPSVSLLLTLVVGLDACSLGRGSQVGSLSPLAACRCGWRGVSVELVRDENAAFAALDEATFDDRFDAVEWIGTATVRPRWRSRGFWAPTRAVRDTTPRITTGTVLTASEHRTVGLALASAVQARRPRTDGATLDEIRSGGARVQTILWSGYAHNAASAVLASLCVVSWTWISARMRSGRRRDAIRRGLCPECAYSLGPANSQGCPECGWGRSYTAGEHADVGVRGTES